MLCLCALACELKFKIGNISALHPKFNLQAFKTFVLSGNGYMKKESLRLIFTPKSTLDSGQSSNARVFELV